MFKTNLLKLKILFLTWAQNRYQKVFNSGLYICAGFWHSKIWQKLHWFIMFHI